MALKRLFVAVSLTDEARHMIAARLDGLMVPGRPVRPDKWHLTLRFLGAVDDLLLDRIRAALDQAALGAPFAVSWGGLGAFPRPSKATVLWLGLERGVEGMGALAGLVEAALEAAGVAPDDRPFRSHLTLSRIRPPQDVTDLVEAFDPIGGRMRVGAVDLYESRLRGPKGAEYEVIESFRLE